MTASAPAVADLLWGSGQGLAAALATYPVPASILAAARNNQLVGNVYDTSGLDTYIGQGNGNLAGFPILNSQPLGIQINVWDASGCTISLNNSPPAGAPSSPTILLTPSGSTPFPEAFSGSFSCFANCGYTVSSFMFAVSAADNLNVGVDWYDGTTASGGNFIKTTSADIAIVASTWQEISEFFTAPPGAHIGFPWAGLFNGSGNIPAGHTVNIAGIFATTPYS
jgi:hypothetical protein